MPGKSIQWSVPRQKHARSCCRSLPAAQSRTCLLLPARPRVSSHLIWVTSPKTPGRSPGMHIASEQWALASLHDLIVAALRACVCVCVYVCRYRYLSPGEVQHYKFTIDEATTASSKTTERKPTPGIQSCCHTSPHASIAHLFQYIAFLPQASTWDCMCQALAFPTFGTTLQSLALGQTSNASGGEMGGAAAFLPSTLMMRAWRRRNRKNSLSRSSTHMAAASPIPAFPCTGTRQTTLLGSRLPMLCSLPRLSARQMRRRIRRHRTLLSTTMTPPSA